MNRFAMPDDTPESEELGYRISIDDHDLPEWATFQSGEYMDITDIREHAKIVAAWVSGQWTEMGYTGNIIVNINFHESSPIEPDGTFETHEFVEFNNGIKIVSAIGYDKGKEII
jgi:hypothetical protein